MPKQLLLNFFSSRYNIRLDFFSTRYIIRNKGTKKNKNKCQSSFYSVHNVRRTFVLECLYKCSHSTYIYSSSVYLYMYLCNLLTEYLVYFIQTLNVA